MDDKSIVDLYWVRSENAIHETSIKYGKYCYAIAFNILNDSEDAAEMLNDTYMGAWNSMPPNRPAILSTFLGKITRRVSINRWNEQHAQKRGNGEMPLALEELSDAVTASDSISEKIAIQELSASINQFLSTLPVAERDMFVCRYWFLTPIKEISTQFECSLSKVRNA